VSIEVLATNDGLHGIVHHPVNSDRGVCAVVVHGAAADCFDGLVWTVCRELAATGIRCAAVNLSARGLGRYADSLRKHRGWPWALTNEAAAEVTAFAERCASQFGEPIGLIGHSWGALVAALATRAVAPVRLVLVSPMRSGRTIVETLFTDSGLAVAEAEHLVASGRGADLILTGSASPPGLSADTILDFFHRTPNGIDDVLPALDIPIHIIVGSREHPALVAAARELADHAAQAQLTVINGAGHFYVGRRAELVDALAMGL
jgi:pimeloyl-ACP methyl ester carboxylesterase